MGIFSEDDKDDDDEPGQQPQHDPQCCLPRPGRVGQVWAPASPGQVRGRGRPQHQAVPGQQAPGLGQVGQEQHEGQGESCLGCWIFMLGRQELSSQKVNMLGSSTGHWST